MTRARDVFAALVQSIQGPIQREQCRIRTVLLEIKGLMPLLMKQRNGTPWTPAERAQLAQHLRGLSTLSPYLIVFLLPGSFVLFPLFAWWLDRRRKTR